MSVRTVKLPIGPASQAPGVLAWPSKDPSDSLPYSLDCAAWLADAGLTLVDVGLQASGGIDVSSPAQLGPIGANAPTLITVQIGGGTPNMTAAVEFDLSLSATKRLIVNVALPIRPALPGFTPVTAPSTPLLPQYGPFQQSTPSSVWTITHGLGRYPAVMVIDSSGNVVEGDVAYPSADVIRISFSAAFAGTAYLT